MGFSRLFRRQPVELTSDGDPVPTKVWERHKQLLGFILDESGVRMTDGFHLHMVWNETSERHTNINPVEVVSVRTGTPTTLVLYNNYPYSPPSDATIPLRGRFFVSSIGDTLSFQPGDVGIRLNGLDPRAPAGWTVQPRLREGPFGPGTALFLVDPDDIHVIEEEPDQKEWLKS